MKINKSLLLLMLIPLIKSIHHLWDYIPARDVSGWIPYCDFKGYDLDIQWYIKDLSELISLSILYGVIILNVKARLLKTVSFFFLFFSIIDIVGYLLLYLQYNLLIQSICLCFIGVYFLLKYFK